MGLELSYKFRPNIHVISRIVEEKEERGISVTDICRRFGVTRKTYYNWLKKVSDDCNSDDDILYGESERLEGDIE